MSVYAAHTTSPHTRTTASTSSHHHGDDSQQRLLPENTSHPDPHTDKTYALITPHRLRSQLLVNNLKASGILPYQADDDDDATGRPAQRLKHSARGLEAIGFDENASMYSSYKGDGGWEAEGKRGADGKEKKEGGEEEEFFEEVGWEGGGEGGEVVMGLSEGVRKEEEGEGGAGSGEGIVI